MTIRKNTLDIYGLEKAPMLMVIHIARLLIDIIPCDLLRQNAIGHLHYMTWS